MHGRPGRSISTVAPGMTPSSASRLVVRDEPSIRSTRPTCPFTSFVIIIGFAFEAAFFFVTAHRLTP